MWGTDGPAAATVAVEGVGTGDVAVEEEFGCYEAVGGVCWGGEVGRGAGAGEEGGWGRGMG